MIAFRSMLVGPAQEAGIKIPPDIDNYDSELYPHWAIFCNMQLCRRIPGMNAHWGNAKIVAAVPEDKIKQMYYHEFLELGFQ